MVRVAMATAEGTVSMTVDPCPEAGHQVGGSGETAEEGHTKTARGVDPIRKNGVTVISETLRTVVGVTMADKVKDTESAILVNATIDTQSESHAIFAAESEIHEIVAVMAVMVVRCEISGWTTPLPEEGINIQAIGTKTDAEMSDNVLTAETSRSGVLLEMCTTEVRL